MNLPVGGDAEGGDAEGNDRRTKIIAAADELLAQDGLEGLTIRAVLKSTGLARRAFYECFAGKDDLVLAVFAQAIRQAADLYSDSLRTVRDPLDRLKWIVTTIVLTQSPFEQGANTRGSRRGAALSREHLRLAESRPAELQEVLAPLIAVIAVHLTEAMAVGAVRKADPQRLATLIYNLVSTTMHTQLMAEEAAPADREGRELLANEIWEFCRGAISA